MTSEGKALLTPAARQPQITSIAVLFRLLLVLDTPTKHRGHLLRCGEVEPARTGGRRLRQGGRDRWSCSDCCRFRKSRSARPLGTHGALALLIPVMRNVAELAGGTR